MGLEICLKYDLRLKCYLVKHIDDSENNVNNFLFQKKCPEPLELTTKNIFIAPLNLTWCTPSLFKVKENLQQKG